MNPKAAVEITARDKTGAGIKAAEKSILGLSRKTSDAAKRSGLGVIGNQLESLTKIRGLGRGFEETSRGVGILGRALSGASTEAAALGLAAESGLGLISGAAIGATTLVAGLGIALIGTAASAYKLGEKWAKVGSEVKRTSESIGVSVNDLQAARAAGERFGISAEQTTAGIDGLATSLYDAKTGANNLAAGALTQLGVKLKQTKDGAIDVHQAMLDISDAIARQKDPMRQRKIASIFGMTGMLPLLRKGSAGIRAEETDFTANKLGLTDAQAAESEQLYKKQTLIRQHLGRIEKDGGLAAIGETNKRLGDHPEVVADAIANGAEKAGKKVAKIADDGKRAVSGLVDAVKHLVNPTDDDDFEAFARRIEHQESRGRQFDRQGRPLTSAAGAVGVMQMLPSTAEATARAHGVPFSLDRLRKDEAYNRMLGTLHLRDRYNARGGNQVLAASDFNAGPGATDRWIKRFGDPRRGGITDADFAARIPFDETRGYVANTAKSRPAPAPPQPTEPQAPAASARVDIHLHNAPKGTVAQVSGGAGVTPTLRVQRALDDY